MNTIDNQTNQTLDLSEKIYELNELSNLIQSLKSRDQKIVHCHGVFDLLHIGHIRHFEEARKFGDILVVTITQDQFVNKGPSRPAFTETLRAEAIAALQMVDYVAINNWPTAVKTIELLTPDYYVKGLEYNQTSNDRTGGIGPEEEAVQSVGGQLVFTDDITFSSSSLINQHLSAFPKDVSEWISGFASRHSSSEVLKYLDSARGIKVLVVGETIIDEYVYCDSLGKAGKEPVLVAREISSDRFAGGIVAVSNHISAVADSVSMLTFLGRTNSYEGIIRDNLNPRVHPEFLYKEGDSPTIVKRRFVENHPFQKLFEVYVMDDGENKASESQEVFDKLESLIPNYDVVVVTDYGHGMLGPREVELLCAESKFLAINTQVNAGNLGFNTVSKYRTADFICVSEKEIRLEARSRRKDLKDIVLDVSNQMGCDQIIITQGPQGCLCYTSQEGFTRVPALALEVVDRIGAGDAVFSVAALCAAQKAPAEITGFIGNVAGAEAVATVGNRDTLERIPFQRHIETILK